MQLKIVCKYFILLLLHFQSANSSDMKEIINQGYITCGLQLVETIPKVLEKKKIKSKHKTIFDAWTQLIDYTTDELYVISQWAMKKEGKGYELYKKFNKLITKSKAILRMIYYNHEDYKYDSKVSPFALKKVKVIQI